MEVKYFLYVTYLYLACNGCRLGVVCDSTTAITDVHLLFMNHLDVGFKDNNSNVGFAYQVLNRYFTEYFPRAINLSQQLQASGHREQFIYTTQPWLVSLYLHCPNITLLNSSLKCPSPKEQDIFRSAVRNGSIAWHAGPMNMETDAMSLLIFNNSLEVSRSLDEEFGIKRTHATYSQRDVPGLTKAVIDPLLQAGVKAISVGVNGGTAPPDVPCPFVWKSGKDSEGIMGFWIKGGYPTAPGPTPSDPGGLARDKCITANGLPEALCFSFRGDNAGPPVTIEEVLMSYNIVRSEFPKANVFASTFDNFVASLETVKDSLPVITSEMGDTWIQGFATDPKRMALYRAFVREYETCFYENQCKLSDPRISDMIRFLIKIPEHTWGCHYFLDYSYWSNDQLAKARNTQPYKDNENSWIEQREFLQFALDALKDHPLKDNVTKAFNDLKPTTPNLTGYVKLITLDKQYKCQDGSVMQFSPSGGLSRLYDPYNKIEWASSDFLLAQLTYDTYVEADFNAMAQQYDYLAGVGFDKANSSTADPEKKQWPTTVVSAYQKNDSSCDFYLEIQFQDSQTYTKYGAPRTTYVHYVNNHILPGLDVTVLIMNKTTTRLAESLSLNFKPKPMPMLSLTLDKMTQYINPCDVLLNGSQYLHAVDTGVRFSFKGKTNGFEILSLDVPVIQIGTEIHPPSPFPVPLAPLNCSSINSVSYNFFNNIWNTNHPLWYPFLAEDADFKASFQIQFNGS